MIWIKCTKTQQLLPQHKTPTIALAKQRFIAWCFVGNILCVFAVISRYVNNVNVTQIVASVKGFLINIFRYKVVTTLHTC